MVDENNAQASDPQAVAVIPDSFDIDAFQHAIIDMDSDLIMGRMIATSRVRTVEKAHDEIVATLHAQLADSERQRKALAEALALADNLSTAAHKLLAGTFKKRVDTEDDSWFDVYVDPYDTPTGKALDSSKEEYDKAREALASDTGADAGEG